ncbi:MAG: BlaI/MecI/CopY family transcriptional regulator [Acidimicrobiales bacterium]
MASGRRAKGALEQAVLAQLWSSDTALTAAEVRTATGGDLAYTTVLTILSRLHAKGMVSREPRGRAHAYRPVLMDPTTTVARITELLSHSTSRTDSLSALATALDDPDRATLREALQAAPPP